MGYVNYNLKIILFWKRKKKDVFKTILKTYTRYEKKVFQSYVKFTVYYILYYILGILKISLKSTFRCFEFLSALMPQIQTI